MRPTAIWLSAISTALLSCVSAGDHILMADCVYAPSRHFADVVLKRLGVETTYFDPTIGAGYVVPRVATLRPFSARLQFSQRF